MKITLEYINDSGSLWAVIDGKKYGLAQTSGELLPVHGIDEVYWSDVPGSAKEVKQLFQDIATAYNQRAQLISALKSLTEFSEYMVRELPYAPPAHLIDNARAVIKETEEQNG